MSFLFISLHSQAMFSLLIHLQWHNDTLVMLLPGISWFTCCSCAEHQKKALSFERKLHFILYIWLLNACLLELLGWKVFLGLSSENRTDQFTLVSVGKPTFKAKAIILWKVALYTLLYTLISNSSYFFFSEKSWIESTRKYTHDFLFP